MAKWLRTRWRRLTFRRRLQAGGPLHITFPCDGIYLVSLGGGPEIVKAKKGDTLTYMDFKSVSQLRYGLDDE